MTLPDSLQLNFDPVSFDTWRAQVEADLNGGDFDRLTTRTLEDIDIRPLYTAADSAATGFARVPGANWDVRQRYEHGEPDSIAAAIESERKRGVTSVWLAAPCADMPALATMLQSVDLAHTHVSLDAGADAAIVGAMLCAIVETGGVQAPRADLNIDPLGNVARLGGSTARIERLAVPAARWCDARGGFMRALASDTRPYHEAGASAVQELSFALATATAYLRVLHEHDMEIGGAARQIGFIVSVGSDFFMEVAKLRALRRCWARVIDACGGSAGDGSAVIHAVTSRRNKTARDPWVNMLRETTEAFSAAVGGADAITTYGFDSAIGCSDDFARRMSRNAQVILDEESHVTHVADPGAGSWYVESLTDEVARAAWSGFQQIESEGGMTKALAAGAVARSIEAIASKRAQLIATRRTPITGVSEFANLDEEPVTRPAPGAQQSEDGAQPAVLAAGDVFQALVRAATQGASRAALRAALAEDGGEGVVPLPRRRDAAAYETCRDASDTRTASVGTRPRAFLCNIGKPAEHRARAGFATGLCNAVGIEVLDNEGFDSVESAAEAFRTAETPVAVLCGSDAGYAEVAEPHARALIDAGAKAVVLAGRPGDRERAYRDAGVTHFMYMGCDVLEVGGALLKTLEVER